MKKLFARLCLPILSLIILSGCSTFNKAYKLKKKGSFNNSNFLEEIDFDLLNNLILVDIEIEGKDLAPDQNINYEL